VAALASLEKALSALPGGYLLLDRSQAVCFVTPRFMQLLHCAAPVPGQALPATLLPEGLHAALASNNSLALQQVYGGQLLDWLLTPLPEGTLVSVREDRQTFRNLVENSPDIISRYDADLVCLFVNSALARYSSLPPLYHVGLGIAERGLPGSMVDAMRHARQQVLHSGQPYTFETEANLPERHLVFEARLLPEYDDGGTLQSLLCIERDITHQHANRLWQADENRLLEMLANDRPLPEVMDWTCRMMDSHLPGAMNSIMLLQQDGAHLQVAAGPGLPEDYKAIIDGIAIGEGVGSCGTCATRGEPVIVSDILHDPLWEAYTEMVRPFPLRACWSHPIMAHDGRVLGTFATYFAEPRSPQDDELNIIQRTSHLMAIAIQQERRASQLFQLATQDALTGLANRRHFLELAGKAFQDARQSGRPLSLLMLDLDHFKSINDRFGHETGDSVLQLFARLLVDGLRGSDLICRMGGEEFAALLPGAGQEEALAAAQRICKAVSGSSLPYQEQQIDITVSVGVCSLDGQQLLLGDMIRQADKALYQAKHEGRNRVCLANGDS